MSGWFSRISPNGEDVISGHTALFYRGEKLLDNAIAGDWSDENTFLYRQHDTGTLLAYHLPTHTSIPIAPNVTWVEGNNGRFVYQISNPGQPPEIKLSRGPVFKGFGGAMRSCSIAPNGGVLIGRNSDGAMFYVPPDSPSARQVAVEGINPWVTDTHGFFELAHQIYKIDLATGAIKNISLEDYEYWPIVRGDWICYHTSNRLIVRSLSTNLGHIIAEGVTRNPHFVLTPADLCVSWTDEDGNLGMRKVSLALEPVDISIPREFSVPNGTVVPNPEEFFTTEFCRTGSHPMAAFYNRFTKTTTFMKFDAPDALEQIQERNGSFHLIYDNTDGKQKPWRIEPNLWFPKGAKVGEQYDFPNARLVRANADGTFNDTHLFPYSIKIRSLTRNVNTPMGFVEVLTIEFMLAPHHIERFHYARYFGWFKWELRNQERYLGSATFDKPHSSPVYPNPPIPIPDPPLPPEEEKPPVMAQYDDNDYVDLGLFLDEKYKVDLHRDAQETFIDSVGRGRWTHDYIRERDKGFSHVSALETINKRINAIVGLPEDESPRPFPKVFSPMTGKLEFYKGWLDGQGYYTPIICHFGEAFSLWTRERDKCKEALKDIVEAKYDGVRTWITLNVGDNPISYWNGRGVSPRYTERYYEQLEEFILYCFNTHNLRVHLAAGDLSGFRNNEESELFDNLATVLARVPNEAILLVEGLNEARDTGDADDTDPAEIERLITIVKRRHPQHLYALSAYTGTEEYDDLKRWTPDWMPFVLVHGYRGGEVHDKVRHIFSVVYEKPVRKWAWQGEPTGPGEWVSATENQHQLDNEALSMMACMALMTGQVWCYMSSPGVKYTQSFKEMPGFKDVPLVREILPKDISTFTDRFHGGESFSFKRLWAVPSTDETRADHVMHSDGRFAVLLYGPRWRECRQVRDCEILQEVEFGPWGKLILGKVS